MKKAFSTIALTFLLAMISCNKERNKTVIVIKDCTGTYLRHDGKDYQVCNFEMFTSYENGTKVKASFKRIETCSGAASDPTTCFMYHENEGWIEVAKIK